MKLLKTCMSLASVGLAAQVAQAAVIDDFSSDTTGLYTTTTILDVDLAGGANTSALEITGGEVTFNTTVFQSVEQLAITRSDVTLTVGQELQLDVARGLNANRAARGDQDFGLFVGAAPVANVRANFIAVFQRDGAQDVQTSIFNAANAGGATNDFSSNPAYDTLFIARTAADTYEAGFYDGATRTILREDTLDTLGADPTIGFYADVRSADILTSDYDNLTIIPEPSSLALLGLSGLALLRRRRA